MIAAGKAFAIRFAQLEKIVSRPNKLHVGRKGDLIDQFFYYDEKTLILQNVEVR